MVAQAESTHNCFFRLPSDMHITLRILSLFNGRSINAEVQAALVEHLQKNKERVEAAKSKIASLNP